jgi:hypothetical protein
LDNRKGLLVRLNGESPDIASFWQFNGAQNKPAICGPVRRPPTLFILEPSAAWRPT